MLRRHHTYLNVADISQDFVAAMCHFQDLVSSGNEIPVQMSMRCFHDSWQSACKWKCQRHYKLAQPGLPVGISDKLFELLLFALYICLGFQLNFPDFWDALGCEKSFCSTKRKAGVRLALLLIHF